MPIYQYFVEQTKKLNPLYISMIMPARWYAGGTGLDEFRETMLHDRHIKELHDFIDASDCFPNVEIKVEVCFFLWNRDYDGDCKVCTHEGNSAVSESVRPLLESGLSTFVRNNQTISILNKVQDKGEKTFAEIVSANDPFGFDMRVENNYKRVKPDYRLKPFDDSIAFYYNGWRKDGIGYVSRTSITKGNDLIDKCKILVPKAWGVGKLKTDKINPFIAECSSVCTETYLVVGPFNNIEEAKKIVYTKIRNFGVEKRQKNSLQLNGASPEPQFVGETFDFE